MSDNPAAPATQSLVAEIVSAYVRKNQIAPADIPALINTVYQSLLTAGEAAEPEPERTPAVPIRQSVRPNYVVCLDCDWRGKCYAATSRLGMGSHLSSTGRAGT
jgi:predicted transcriptional regulator